MPPKKRATERLSPTDEWGIYDPARAGMPALFARLGKPVLRQSDASARREKRRGSRPERSNDGVCLAIDEVIRRAFPPAAAPPAAEAIVVADTVPEAPSAPPTAAQLAKSLRQSRATSSSKPSAKRVRLRAALLEAAAKTQPNPVRAAAASATVVATPEPTPKVTRKPVRVKAAVRASTPVSSEPQAPKMLAPSPRRPRGAVPLAAWAHAVVETAPVEPTRHDARGLWRSLFRIPSEIALIGYGRGCRIHRIVIETTSETGEPF